MNEDCAYICQADYLPWEALGGKTLFLTGATGLIGYTLTQALLYANEKKKLDLQIVALVRDESRARQRFENVTDLGRTLRFLEGTVEDLPPVKGPADYILHCAAQTDSAAFVQHPAQTARSALLGTLRLLELARHMHSLGFVFLSSTEVYGSPPPGKKVSENDVCPLRPLESRSSYPVSKLQCENLCHAYACEYGVPASAVRLTQTFGPGVRPGDMRVFAQFGRCARDGQDIVLHTRGETERCYLYTADAVTAVLAVLLKGEPGQAYNAADERTYCSVAQMAGRVADAYGIRVRTQPREGSQYGYGPALCVNPDTSRLRGLGWSVGKRPEQIRDPLLFLYERMLEGGFEKDVKG